MTRRTCFRPFNLNVYVKPLKRDAPEKAYGIDMRGNTDESLDRAVRYIVENNMGGGKQVVASRRLPPRRRAKHFG